MSPYVWGLAAGGLLGVLLERKRRGGRAVQMSPKLPKTLRQKNRLNLPGQERGIGR